MKQIERRSPSDNIAAVILSENAGVLHASFLQRVFKRVFHGGFLKERVDVISVLQAAGRLLLAEEQMYTSSGCILLK